MPPTPRTSREKAEKQQKAEYELKCVTDFEMTKRLDNMPRDMDTFWVTDTATPKSHFSGRSGLSNPKFNKGVGFTFNERRLLSIHGLLPASVQTIDMQVKCCQLVVASMSGPLQRYAYIMVLSQTNIRLFYRFLLSDIELYMPMIDASSYPNLLEYNKMLSPIGRGLYITIKDLGHVHQVLSNWPIRHVRCLVVSNGASIQSFGDLGINQMPALTSVMHQNVVYSGIHPDFCLCVLLDLGTNNEELLKDRFYMGLKERRPPQKLYDEFFEEFTMAVLRMYGSRALILCKDFESQYAKRQLEMYRERHCIVDVDFQCMAACALSAIIVCNNAVKRVLFTTNMILFYGADLTNVGMAKLCIAYLKREGLNETSARQRIWFCDAEGLIVIGRPNIPEELLEFANPHEPIPTLVEAIQKLKPNVLVGGCSQANVFTPDVLRAMEQSAQQPIIFALSRPISLAECTPDAAFAYTKGRCVFISGSKLPPIKYANKMYQPGYCSSHILLPGLTLGVMLAGFTTVPDETFCVAAERLAHMVWPKDLAMRNVFPPMKKIQCISLHLAEAVFTYAFRRGLATMWPRPENPLEYIKSKMYDSSYRIHGEDVYCMQERKIATTESENYYQLSI
ncbi:NADP-dependent malic enzyme [Drosophila serrata]|uniref:NADP-dependent malic enzyme n=1 Tax=Drosophila serrata TaxID=7274 RepID=UPI000A1D0216|nr:NADP-dependent malic enzyme [Drosophila serrata]